MRRSSADLIYVYIYIYELGGGTGRFCKVVALCMGGVVGMKGRVWDIGMNKKRGSDDEEEERILEEEEKKKRVE